ncbi:MAG: low temperature requirement protein A, partial [Nocardioidaceae bacterium]
MPLVRPPSLRTSQTRSASQLELFFDLAYVLAVAELASLLMARAGWGGAGRFAALFAVVFLSWVSFTLYANRFDTDDIIFRLAKFAGMGAILGCAASMSAATESKATVFAASYLAGRLVLVGLYWRA